MDGDGRGAQGRNWVSLACYALAFGVLAGGVLLGLVLTSAAALVPAASSGFLSAPVKPLWDTWLAGLRLLGTVEIAASVLISGLLAACGLLWGRTADLAARVAALETQSSAGEAATPDPAAE